MLALALSLFSPAHAGKLADGFRGLAFGPASVLDQPPQPQGCVMGEATTVSATGARWSCAVEINGVTVDATYIIEAGVFYGVQITPPRNFAAAVAVYDALTAAYGVCVKRDKYATGNMPDCTWSDGEARAVWEYNPYSDKSAVSLFDRAVYNTVEAARKSAAEAAASGL